MYLCFFSRLPTGLLTTSNSRSRSKDGRKKMIQNMKIKVRVILMDFEKASIFLPFVFVGPPTDVETV